MSQEMMNTKELAAYLNLNEKKVYALIQQGGIPGTKVTGKWIFPKSLVDQWIHANAERTGAVPETHDVLVMGSHDLLMEVLAEDVSRRYPETALFRASVGSIGGLTALHQRRCHIAGVHLLDPEANEYNLPYIPRYAPDLETVVVHFVDREQGLLVLPGNPHGISGIEDLAKQELRFVNRQRGSGTRVLLDYHLRKAGIDASLVRGYDDDVSTHTEVAWRIRQGFADLGLSIRAAALASGLDFIPIARERFDFVIPRRCFYTQPIQQVLDVMRSEMFRENAAKVGGYDLGDVGAIVTW